MASLHEGTRVARHLLKIQRPRQAYPLCLRRGAATQATSESAPASGSPPALLDLEADSSFTTPAGEVQLPLRGLYNPKSRANKRKHDLPGSRYQYHPPKYNRGPLHPIQSPLSSDPVARDFVPGPFSFPRLKQTYEAMIASDIMTMAYSHRPPGTVDRETPERLRGWDDSSPYHQNRARRGPRGGANLRLIEQDITFRNIPEIKAVTLASYVPRSAKEPDHLVVARSMMQSITGTVPEITRMKSNVAQWGVIKGKQAGVKTTLYGNEAYEFLDKCIHLVFPRIKDWKGIKGSTGDSSGNLSWGFTPEDMALFPEIEFNFAMYPPKMLPGCRIYVQTTAKSDRHARLLFEAIGIPFHGKLHD